MSQHCQTHFSKNRLDRTPGKLQPELKIALTDLENTPDLGEAIARKNQLLERYHEEAPKEVHEKWVTGKNTFTMERYEADNEEAKEAMQLDRNEPNHTVKLTA